MKNIIVKENNTKLVEVLFEFCEIDSFSDLDNYLNKYLVTMNIYGTDRKVPKELQLMRNDILTIKEI